MKQPFYSKEEMLELVTSKDCKELKQLVLENPEAPLIIFAGEEANSYDYTYESCICNGVSLKELVLTNPDFDKYHDIGQWMDKDDYEDWLGDILQDYEEYDDLSDEEYNKMIQDIVNKTEFIKAICIYVG